MHFLYVRPTHKKNDWGPLKKAKLQEEGAQITIFAGMITQ